MTATTEPVPEGASDSDYRWVVLAVGTLVVFASLGLARFGYTTVLPAMQADLSLDNTQAGLLASANLVGYLALAVIGGALASRFGPRVVIAIGLGVAGVAMVLTGLAHGAVEVAAWRALTGVGSGASNVPVRGLLAAWFAPRRRGLASGIAVAGSSVALILLGPVVPRVLAQYGPTGWRICWFGFGALALVVAALSMLLLRNSPAGTTAGDHARDGDASRRIRGHEAHGLQWGAVYGSSRVWHLGAVYVAFGFSYIIYLTFFVKCLVSEGGCTPAGAGRLLMVLGWSSLLCGLIWGTVSDAIGRKWALVIVYLIQATAFSLFALWPTTAGFTLSAVLFGLTAWSIPAIMAAACGDLLGPRLAPAALGFITLFLGIGQALGPTVAGAVADVVHSLFPTMLLAAGVALLGALGAALLRPTGAEHSTPETSN